MNDSLNHAQQVNIFDPHACQPVTLIGAGSVGSMIAVRLAKLGIRHLRVIDHDFIESHNIPMSEYRPCDIGQPKVTALARIIRQASGLVITAEHRRYEGGRLTGTVIACVDRMEVRMAIWEAVRMNPAVDLLIDTRNAEEFISVFAIRPCEQGDIDYYTAFLYPGDTALNQTCGRHGVCYIASFTADIALAQLAGFWMNGKTKRHHRQMAGSLEVVE